MGPVYFETSQLIFNEKLLTIDVGFFAPQAPLEESATTEASRRCSLNGMLTGIRVLFWGQVLERFATGICVLTVQNTSPEQLRIGRILSACMFVCLFVCLFVRSTFCRPLFGPVRARIQL